MCWGAWGLFERGCDLSLHSHLPRLPSPPSLSELEHTRDELLIQLYQSEDAFVDKNTVSGGTRPLMGDTPTHGEHAGSQGKHPV